MTILKIVDKRKLPKNKGYNLMVYKLYMHKLFMGLLFMFSFYNLIAQQSFSFKKLTFGSSKIRIYKIYITKKGEIIILSSTGLWYLIDDKLEGPIISNQDIYKDSNTNFWRVSKVNSGLNDGTRGGLVQGADSLFYFISYNKLFIWESRGKINKWNWPYFWESNNEISNQQSPLQYSGESQLIYNIWSDSYGNLYAGTDKGLFITEVEKHFDKKNKLKKITPKGLKTIGFQIPIYAFAQDPKNRNRVWMGTKGGLSYYSLSPAIPMTFLHQNDKSKTAITELYTGDKDMIWFSALEKGMGVYNLSNKSFQFFPFKKENKPGNSKFSVRTFCYKSPDDFFVAGSGSFPAIFNIRDHSYSFIYDSALSHDSNEITDIKIDGRGNLLLLKGGNLYYSDISKGSVTKIDEPKSLSQNDSSALTPFIKKIELLDGTPLATLEYHPESLKRIVLKQNQNNLIIHYDVNSGSGKKNIYFAWKVDGYTKGWTMFSKTDLDNDPIALIQGLPPGQYQLQVQVITNDYNWRSPITELIIVVTTPVWRAWWFWPAVIIGLGLLLFFIVKIRVNAVRKQEKLKATHEKELLELESKALRAQMNPHFIFNCLNSIKALIQEDEKQKATDYLTTFSKLIRTLFQNSDKRQISLFDEVETCRLYTELEAMRLDGKLNYNFNIDPNIDLKSVMVPALIIQPFIENAIWHGIVPKEEGTITVTIKQHEDAIICEVDDNGIGRELSRLNKPVTPVIHESKGVHLSQARIDLEKKLNESQASIKIIDKYENNKAAGTLVVLTFNLN